VTSPLRAVLAAHLQASKNRLVRQLGVNGVLLLVVAVLLMTFTIILPIVLGLSVGAFFLSRSAFDAEGNPELGNVIGLILTAVSIGGGLIGGVAGGAKQLEWEQYRGFPLRPGTLFSAEVLAGLGDAITLIQATTIFGICVATAAAAPQLSFVMFFLAIESVVLLLCVQLLVGSFAERLVKRMRLALAATVGLAFIFSQVIAAKTVGPSPFKGASLRKLGENVLELASYLPASQAIRAAHRGEWAGLSSGVLLLAGVLLLSYFVLLRERDSAVVEGAGKPDKLWSHATPVLAVARLQLETLLGSHLGKFAFAMPLITLVLIRGPFSELAGTGRWLIPGAFIYISLAANGLGFNQFGLDGHGVKALFLLPIAERTILEGKQLGFAAWQSMQAVLLAALLMLVQTPQLDELFAGMMLFVCYFFAQGVVGQRTSIWLPRRMLRTSMKNSQIPLPVVLISLATTLVSGLVFGTAWWALSTFVRPLLLPGMVGVALLAFLASRPFVGLNAGFLARHRERIVEGVG
jgi:hypothetical protein